MKVLEYGVRVSWNVTSEFGKKCSNILTKCFGSTQCHYCMHDPIHTQFSLFFSYFLALVRLCSQGCINGTTVSTKRRREKERWSIKIDESIVLISRLFFIFIIANSNSIIFHLDEIESAWWIEWKDFIIIDLLKKYVEKWI